MNWKCKHKAVVVLQRSRAIKIMHELSIASLALQMTPQRAQKMGKWRCPACERRGGH
jgi:hypothetical protein